VLDQEIPGGIKPLIVLKNVDWDIQTSPSERKHCIFLGLRFLTSIIRRCARVVNGYDSNTVDIIWLRPHKFEPYWRRFVFEDNLCASVHSPSFCVSFSDVHVFFSKCSEGLPHLSLTNNGLVMQPIRRSLHCVHHTNTRCISCVTPTLLLRTSCPLPVIS
jgi:hypothetical protein